jgi:hypothetical protein
MPGCGVSDGTRPRYDPGWTEVDSPLPEYALSAIQTESMVRDLSPIQTSI